jgi:hypothetical protein
MPSFPFIFIWLASFLPRFCRTAKELLDRRCPEGVNSSPSKGIVRGAFAMSLAPVLLLWSVASSAWIYPHSLSFFNESIGGPLNGPKHLLFSNVAWGQDARYLIWSLRPTCDVAILAGRVAGVVSSDMNLAELLVPRSRAKAQDSSVPQQRNHRGRCCLFAMSVNFLHGLHGARAPLAGNGCNLQSADILAMQFRSTTCDYYAGYSIRLAKVPCSDVSYSAVH